MVLDPFSVLSLAGNIIQFLDFGQKLLSKGREIYKSADGTTTTHIELEVIYHDLWTVADKLAARSPPSPASSTDNLVNYSSTIADDQIWHLATSCQTVAQELLSIVRELRVDPESKHRKWKSFRQAMKALGKKSQIDELQQRLKTFREELTIRLVAVLGDQQSLILHEIQKLGIENIRLNLNQNDRLEDLAKHIEEVRITVRERLAAAATKIDLEELASRIHNLALQCTGIAREQRILSSLHYTYMHARMANVVKAYNKTFDWIFEPECDVGFVQWLEKDDGIYWVSGKPGSGKSTLMKYLYQHPRTHELLKQWADGTELITASFFFWSIGTQMQKTQEGLLRSLIFAILQQSPNLIPKACPAFWSLELSDAFSEDFWTLEQLRNTLSEIVIYEETASKFCFFIDGLDEYAGHHPDLVHALNSLARSRFIKICASSRPWNIFEDAYGRNTSRKIYLEQLTRGDIELYVRSRLEEHTHLAMLSLEDVGISELVNDIVTRAQGVFLWVYLVLLSLCEGLTNGDDASLLQDRLRLIPSDLETFFRLILDSVDAVYKDKMAQTFQVVLQSTEPLTLLTLSFLDQRDLDARLQDSVSAMDRYELFDRHTKTRQRINGRYKGLLEIMPVPSATDYFGYRVDFFHRTVHDFIRLNDIQQFLRGHLPVDFNAHSVICKILLMTMRRMSLRRSDVARDGDFRVMLSNFMFHTRQLEIETNTSPTVLLEDMESTLSELYKVYRVRACRNFMDLAIQSGLQFYVCQRLVEEPQAVGQYLTPFLKKLLWSLKISSVHENRFSAAPETIAFLLGQGVDPNCRLGSSTAFGEFLLEIMNPMDTPSGQLNQYRELISQQYYVLTILLQHNADPNAPCVTTSTIWETFLRALYNNGKPRSTAHQKILLKIVKSLIEHGADLTTRSRVNTAGYRFTVSQVIRAAFLESRQRILLRMVRSRRTESRRCSAFMSTMSRGIEGSVQSLKKLFRVVRAWWYPPPQIILDEEEAGIQGLTRGGQYSGNLVEAMRQYLLGIDET